MHAQIPHQIGCCYAVPYKLSKTVKGRAAEQKSTRTHPSRDDIAQGAVLASFLFGLLILSMLESLHAAAPPRLSHAAAALRAVGRLSRPSSSSGVSL